MNSKRTLLALVMLGLVSVVVHFIPSSEAMAISKPAFVGERTFSDLPDDSSGNQIHVMYVLPSDGVDESLDTNGALARSVATFQRWLAGQAGGQRLRLDYFRGALDVTFFRMSQTDAQIASTGPYVRDQIESELIGAGFNSPNKIYAVYYGGGSTYSCGGGAWPPEVPGKVSAIYLKGTPPGAPACSTNSLASSEDKPGYFEFAMLHDVIHALGIVATCAPNHTLRGHVSDSPNDLMYAGSLPWYPSVLDIGRDDYFKHNNPGCLDLARSPYMTSNITISGLLPASAVAGGGAFTLTVNGANFADGATITFNGNNRNTTFVSAAQLTARIEAADITAVGTYPITVVNPSGAASEPAIFRVTNALRIDSVTPAAGRTSGGQQLKLKGSFADLSSIAFGGTTAVWSYTNGNTEITVTTPAHVPAAVSIDLNAAASGTTYSKANAFAYLPTVFTDDQLVARTTVAKAQHVLELRQAVDALRVVAGLAPAPWTDTSLSPSSAFIKAVHIAELRTYLDDAATRLGYATVPYTDPSLGTGLLSIKRTHIEELRQRIRSIAG